MMITRALSVCVLIVMVQACEARPTPTVSPISPISPAATPRAQIALTPRVYFPVITNDHDNELDARPISPKKGVTLACGSARLAQEIAYLRVAWVWNWNPDPPVFAGVESVPSIVGRDIPPSLAGNSPWVLGFNEPDLNALSPAQGADAWARIEALYPARKLASPQPSHLSRTWLVDWRNAYISIYERAPRLDALAFHCYLNSARACIELGQYYIGLARAWHVPEVWITEFAFSPGQTGSVQRGLEELAAFVAWAEAEPMIGRYAVWSNRLECCAGQTACGYDPLSDAPMFYWFGRASPFGRAYRRFP